MNKLLITLLALFLMSFGNGNRGELLCSIDNKRVSLYINSIYTDAETVANESGLPLGLLISMSCLESKYGESDFAINRCNHLGIKYNGVYATFDNQLECFRAWARVLQKPCYKEIECTSLNLWLYNLDYCCYHMAGGRYSKKIRWIYKEYNLEILDNF